MVFSTLPFLFKFMPIFFGCYYLMPRRWRNVVLLLGSLTFYAIGTVEAPEHFFIFIASMAVDYGAAMLMERYPQHKRWFLVAGVVFHLLALGFFKYFTFLAGEIRHLLPGSTFGEGWKILLPIGISFYTFQGISYIVDVYRGSVKAQPSFLRYCVYLSMFEQLIAGPIVTYSHVEKDLPERTIHVEDALRGLGIFIFGMGLKVLLANPIGKLWMDVQNIGFESISTPLAWMAIFAFSFQLYFDFWGYSLMAIGLGRMLGFTLPKNFDFPYLSRSMTEFWRRWHMTLGNWFREYVYIPLGGNRRGRVRTVCNLLIVWVLTGVWHGAGYNFLLWGTLLFAVIFLEKNLLGKYLDRWPVLGHLYMFFLIPLSWAVFAIDDMGQMGIFFGRLFACDGQGLWSVFRTDYLKYGGLYWPFFLAAFVLSTHWPFEILKKCKNKLVIGALLLGIFGASVYCMYRGLNDPFLYFRF